jgi:3-methylcrotonyl-CoA carboxylase alpha subunit
MPQGPGIRVDSGIQSGDQISIHYDPMIAKIIVHDRIRLAAIQRMRGALQQMVVLGLTTNVDFLLSLLDHPAFVAGEVDTGYVDRHLDDILPAAPQMHPEGLIALAVAEMQGKAATTEPAGAAADSDRYSPWNRADRFRIGLR